MCQKTISTVTLLMLVCCAAAAASEPATEPTCEIQGLTAPNLLTLVAGKQAVLTVPHTLRAVALGNSHVAEFHALSPHQILVTGSNPGVTNLILVVDGDHALSPIDVTVTPAPVMPSPETAHMDFTAAAAPIKPSRWFAPHLLWLTTALLPLVALIVFLEPLIRRGKIRMLVLTWIWTWFVVGQICFAWGMAALGHGEPIRQVGPMLLASVLVWTAMLFASRRMNRRYRDVELKRMQLMDIG